MDQMEFSQKLAHWLEIRAVEQGVCFARPLCVYVKNPALRDWVAALVNTATKARNQPEATIECAAVPSTVYDLFFTDTVIAPAVSFTFVYPGGLITDGRSVWRIRSHDYSFADAQKEWSAPPFTSIGYFSTEQLLRDCTDEQIKDSMERQRHYRYDGYVNDGNKWRAAMGYDTLLIGKTVLDFGCGTGIEALEFARASADVILVDIAPFNVAFAKKCFDLFGFQARLVGTDVAKGEEPFFFCPDGTLDIFASVGVLHHTPKGPDILRRARRALKPGGQCRAIFYSEHTWPHTKDPKVDVTTEPGFFGYVRGRDSVGKYATWYNREKIEYLLGDVYTVVNDGICGSGEYYWCWLEGKDCPGCKS